MDDHEFAEYKSALCMRLGVTDGYANLVQSALQLWLVLFAVLFVVYALTGALVFRLPGTAGALWTAVLALLGTGATCGLTLYRERQTGSIDGVGIDDPDCRKKLRDMLKAYEEDPEKRALRDAEIKRECAEDEERYQSIFATKIGAVAAPAACLHFSKILVKRLEIKGVDVQFLTSHMGLGNFRAIDVEDLTKHKVDSEQFEIGQELTDAVDRAHGRNGRVCAVGTEVMRALESVVNTAGQIAPTKGWTNRFIFPPYHFTVANSFFVNLYMPQSSQLIEVAAFGGYEQVMRAYNVAVKEKYHFGDYGDSMLILN
jgi:hypothetical protein